MESNDLRRLSPHDLELLLQDIVGRMEGAAYESFGVGRDRGVDLRRRLPTGGDHIVQVKHYADSTHRDLLRAVRKERLKVAALDPERYWLATSREMTIDNKTQLQNEISGWAPETRIITGSEIAHFLREHEDIQLRHPKLWIPATGILTRLLNAAAYSRTEQFLREAAEELPVFVGGATRDKAMEALSDERVLVLTGDPGVGKTSLARNIALEFAARNYQVHFINDDIRDGHSLYTRAIPQLFVFDDFLGQTQLNDVLHRNESSDLGRFVAAIRATDQSLLVLTTRDYILHAAVAVDDRMKVLVSRLQRIVVSLNGYTQLDKARILFNHLHFSTLPRTALKEFSASGAYRDVIDHAHYNPRLITQVIDLYAVGEEDGSEFPRFFLESFNDPTSLWSTVYFQHLGHRERAVLLGLLVSFGTSVNLTLLRSVWASILSHFDPQAMTSSRELREALKILEPTFVKLDRQGGFLGASFANAGIRDVVMRLSQEDEEMVTATIASISEPSSLGSARRWIGGFSDSTAQQRARDALSNIADSQLTAGRFSNPREVVETLQVLNDAGALDPTDGRVVGGIEQGYVACPLHELNSFVAGIAGLEGDWTYLEDRARSDLLEAIEAGEIDLDDLEWVLELLSRIDPDGHLETSLEISFTNMIEQQYAEWALWVPEEDGAIDPAEFDRFESARLMLNIDVSESHIDVAQQYVWEPDYSDLRDSLQGEPTHAEGSDEIDRIFGTFND